MFVLIWKLGAAIKQSPFTKGFVFAAVRVYSTWCVFVYGGANGESFLDIFVHFLANESLLIMAASDDDDFGEIYAKRRNAFI